MNQDNIILLEAGTPDFKHLKEAIAYAEETGSYIRFYLEPATSETLYEVGDRIETYGDMGPWSPAEVTSVSDEYVSIKYGRGFKHHTSVSRYSGSIRTSKRRTTPAGLQVKAYEGQWSMPMESHRPKGGY